MRRIQQAAFVLLLAGVVAGCGASRPVKYYVLDVGPAPAVAPARAGSRHASGFAHHRFASVSRRPPRLWQRRPCSSGTYEYERWAEPPAELMQDMVITSLRSSGTYRSVSRISSSLRGDYIVRGQLLRAGRGAVAWRCPRRFSFQLGIVRSQNRCHVWSGAYTHDEPVNGKKVSDVVEALDRDVRAGLTQLTGELGQYFASHPPPTSAGQ